MKVFVSYSHDSDVHKDRVLDLSDRLRADGIDCRIDQYELSPPEGWPRWMIDRVREAEFVLVVCTETYNLRFEGREAPGRGKGAKWEGGVITQELYDAEGKNSKFIPIIFDPLDSPHIPLILKGATYYDLSAKTGYDLLYRHLTSQPLVRMPALGKMKPMPPLERKQKFMAGGFHIAHGRNPFFTGREKLLDDLEQALKAGGRAALSGLGGVGKTQTVVEYAYRHRDEYPQGVLWAKASTREELISDFAAIAQVLDLPGKDAEDQNIGVNAAKRWFEENSGWLLILDNADDLKMAKEFIPSGKSHVILTTRATATGSVAKCVDVSEMPTEEGALFLLRRAKIVSEDASFDDASEDHRNAAIEISEEMGGLPLALDQAGAFIEETGCSLSGYLEMYIAEGGELRARRGDLAAGHKDPVATTWNMSFRKVEEANPAAADILRLCAFLAPDAIPEEIFTKGAKLLGKKLAPVAKSPVGFNKALGELQKYSLIRRDSTDKTFDIHRLVQEVLRDGMDQSMRLLWANTSVCVLKEAVEYVGPDNWLAYERLLSSVQLAARLIESMELHTAEAALLLNGAGVCVRRRGRYAEAEQLIAAALGICEEVRGTDHTDTAIIQNNLATLYLEVGNYEKADIVFRESLATKECLLGSEHPRVAVSISNLAFVCYSQHQYGKAESLYLRALDIMSQTPTPELLHVATILNNLGMLYCAQGEYGKAESIHQRSLEIRQTHLEPTHPDISQSLHNLAVLYHRVGNHGKADAMFRAALEIHLKTYGLSHPNTAIVLECYADLLRETGRAAEAEEMETRAKAIREKHARENPSGK